MPIWMTLLGGRRNITDMPLVKWWICWWWSMEWMIKAKKCKLNFGGQRSSANAGLNEIHQSSSLSTSFSSTSLFDTFWKLGFLMANKVSSGILQGFWYRFLVDAKIYEIKNKFDFWQWKSEKIFEKKTISKIKYPIYESIFQWKDKSSIFLFYNLGLIYSFRFMIIPMK